MTASNIVNGHIIRHSGSDGNSFYYLASTVTINVSVLFEAYCTINELCLSNIQKLKVLYNIDDPTQVIVVS